MKTTQAIQLCHKQPQQRNRGLPINSYTYHPGVRPELSLQMKEEGVHIKDLANRQSGISYHVLMVLENLSYMYHNEIPVFGQFRFCV